MRPYDVTGLGQYVAIVSTRNDAEDNHKFACWWWLWDIETIFTLLVLCEGNPSVFSGFAQKGPVVPKFNIFFGFSPNKLLNAQSVCRWFETPWRSYDATEAWWRIYASMNWVVIGRGKDLPIACSVLSSIGECRLNVNWINMIEFH